MTDGDTCGSLESIHLDADASVDISNKGVNKIASFLETALKNRGKYREWVKGWRKGYMRAKECKEWTVTLDWEFVRKFAKFCRKSGGLTLSVFILAR